MTTRKLPLNTWMVVRQYASWKNIDLVSKHDTQQAAEAERDRRNTAAADRPYRACVVVEPVAQRMGGQFAPTATKSRTEPRYSCRSLLGAHIVEEITGDMKVGEVVRRWPQTAEVFRTKRCPDAENQFTARIMTVRSVARMDGVDLASLLAELNRAAVHLPTR
jgi:Domain of unknown function (DUF1858)